MNMGLVVRITGEYGTIAVDLCKASGECICGKGCLDGTDMLHEDGGAGKMARALPAAQHMGGPALAPDFLRPSF